MESTCRRAIEIGLPGLAFTEHADFVQIHAGQHALDLKGYLGAINSCRQRFPALRILSGVELGEPHHHQELAAEVLSGGDLDRVLGSVHCLRVDGRVRDMSEKGVLTADSAPATFRAYLAEVLALTSSPQAFLLLAHLDYPKRYWPHRELEFRVEDFEEEYRAVLRELMQRGSVLEVNTTRGAEPHRGLCPGPPVLRWWREIGGTAVSFGSDTHEPARLAAGFQSAAGVVEAAGFRPSRDPAGFWLR
ncbi:MAG: PHP domain-containing protein [Candidatus Dormibacteraeota bacterium]|nr:PHP domain-containing protein [Candidatus Dormibacteraeota bacterium]